MIHRVLGVDPGLAETGWGIVESDGNRLTHLDHGTVKTPKTESLASRLLSLHSELTAVISAFKPQGMGVETVFFTKNISSAIPVAQARGVLLLAGIQAGITIQEFSPVTIKQSVVGAGGADKNQIQDMVRILLGLSQMPETDHAADALASAITFIHYGSLWSTVSSAF